MRKHMRASEIKRSILSDYLSQRLVFTLHFALGRQFGPNNPKKVFSHLLQISCYVVTFRQCVLLCGECSPLCPARWWFSPMWPCYVATLTLLLPELSFLICKDCNKNVHRQRLFSHIYIVTFATFGRIYPLVKLMHFYTQSNANISYVRMVFSFVFLFVWAMICQKPFVLLSQSHCHYCRVPERDRWK